MRPLSQESGRVRLIVGQAPSASPRALDAMTNGHNMPFVAVATAGIAWQQMPYPASMKRRDDSLEGVGSRDADQQLCRSARCSLVPE
jgi:hypothetical protein